MVSKRVDNGREGFFSYLLCLCRNRQSTRMKNRALSEQSKRLPLRVQDTSGVGVRLTFGC